MPDNETSRYLASYLAQHSHELVSTAFSYGEYREYHFIDEHRLYELICKFYDELP